MTTADSEKTYDARPVAQMLMYKLDHELRVFIGDRTARVFEDALAAALDTAYAAGRQDWSAADELQDIAAGRKEWEAAERGTCGYMFCHNDYCVFNKGHTLPHRDADGDAST